MVRPRLCAAAAASPRLARPSLARMCDTCTPAVRGLMKSSAPICRLVRPAARSRSTSSSRLVNLRPAPGSGPSAHGSLGAGQRDAGPAGQRFDLLSQLLSGQ